MDIKDIIVAPVITEKSMKDAQRGKFTFRVSGKADKTAVKKAIERFFKANVLSVQTSIVKGKKIKAGVRRVEVLKGPWKKAIVTLKKGQKIDLFDVGRQSS